MCLSVLLPCRGALLGNAGADREYGAAQVEQIEPDRAQLAPAGTARHRQPDEHAPVGVLERLGHDCCRLLRSGRIHELPDHPVDSPRCSAFAGRLDIHRCPDLRGTKVCDHAHRTCCTGNPQFRRQRPRCGQLRRSRLRSGSVIAGQSSREDRCHTHTELVGHLQAQVTNKPFPRGAHSADLAIGRTQGAGRDRFADRHPCRSHVVETGSAGARMFQVADQFSQHPCL
jgi:hypothetical protein